MKMKENQDKRLQNSVEEATHFTFRVVLKGIQWFFNILFTILLVGIVAGCIVGCAFLVYVANNVDSNVDDIVMFSGSQDASTRMFYYKDGELVEDETQRLSGGTNRIWISYDQIPNNLVNAYIAIEDKRFWDHDGVDWITTMKAAFKFIIPTGSNPGGSTITQQLIKNRTGDDEYTIQRKVQEIFKAMNLEKNMDKKDIMEMYLNSIYLSQGCTGVQAAAYKYFSKDASELSLIECAAIAAITQNPSKWDPILNPLNNAERRNNIIKEMYNQGLITRAEFEEAYKQELVLNVKQSDGSTGSSSGTSSWYTDAVINECIDLLSEKYGVTSTIAAQMLYAGGYNIVTAMDEDVQSVLEKYYADKTAMGYLPTSQVVNVESSMLVMDPYTGNVVGLVGGRGEKNEPRLLNRATMTRRQPGSSIKPIAVYGPAMDAGVIHYGSVYIDSPFTTTPKPWPQNANRSYRNGPMTIDYALTTSKNTIAVKVLNDLGVNNSYRFMTEKLHIDLVEGIQTDWGVKSDKNLASLALGGLTNGVTVEEMVAAYCIFPSGGIYSHPRTVLQIQNSAGQVIIDNSPKAEVVISEGTAQSMIRLMEHVISGTEGVSGTAASAKTLQNMVGAAGKTGTTDDDNDRWFVGYTPYYAAGIWIGYDIPQSLSSRVGGAQHLKLWCAIMEEIHQNLLKKVEAGTVEKKTFNDDLLIKAKYCKTTGMLPTSGCSTLTGYFTKDTLPSVTCNKHG